MPTLPPATAWSRLKQLILSTEQVRRVDRLAIEEYGMHPLVLMENPALGCVQWIVSRFPQPAEATILCGSGNNGGDGLVIARHLRTLGWTCHACVLGPLERLSPDAAANWLALSAHDIEENGVTRLLDDSTAAEEVVQSCLQSSQLVVDAMLGTGVQGAPREPLASWIHLANHAAAFRLAIDIPTGVDAETGQVHQPAFHAQATLTFVGCKPAMHRTPAGSPFGDIEVLPIGLPEPLLQRLVAEYESA